MKVRSKCVAAALALAACGPSGTSSTGVGNPSVSFSLSIVNDADEPELAGGQSNAGAPGNSDAEASAGASVSEPELPLARGQVQNAWLSLGAIEFLPCDSSLQGPKLPGPFVVDLLGQRTMPELPPIPEVEGGYCGIDAPLAPAQRQGTLLGRSLFFDGVRADGTRFLLYANMRAVLRLRAKYARPLTTETPNLLWGLRPRRWLSTAEVDTAESDLFDGARTVVIDADRHPLLYRKIRARLAGRSALYPDRNENRVIDTDERATELMFGDENVD